MSARLELYMDPQAMGPLRPTVDTELNNLAVKLVEVSAKLSNAIHPLTRMAIADFLRPMNSYYSNLIEGHDTHPIDIERALNNDYSSDKDKRNLQLEAAAHIGIHKYLSQLFEQDNLNPYDQDFIKSVHYQFYQHLPDEFREAKTLQDGKVKIIPGEFRKKEVKVGSHVGPSSAHLYAFLKRFETFYNPSSAENSSRTTRIINIAAAHHRFAWIHPFVDGNGRVVRLFSDACFMNEGLDGSGLWSMSRGLARSRQEYIAHLANADLPRLNDWDGRGNLSEKMLVAFCRFFLETAIDQVQFMTQVLNIDEMLRRIHKFVDLMAAREKLKPETRFVLETAFLKGAIAKREVEHLTGKSDKTAKAMAESLLRLGLLKTNPENRLAPYEVSYPITFSPILFSDLYPAGKEIEMMNLIK